MSWLQRGIPLHPLICTTGDWKQKLPWMLPVGVWTAFMAFLPSPRLLPILNCVFSWTCTSLAPHHNFINTCFPSFTKPGKEIARRILPNILTETLCRLIRRCEVMALTALSSSVFALVTLCRLEGRCPGQCNSHFLSSTPAKLHHSLEY